MTDGARSFIGIHPPRKGAILLLAALSLLLGEAGCYYRLPPFDDALTARTPPNLPPLPEGRALRVLVLGDFGTGGSGQREVSKAIAETHASAPPDLVLTVGDNIYPSGVESVRDPLWTLVFERVYAGDFWSDLVFFPSLGNHDVEGNERAQIDYSDRSPRWTMPGNYYTFQRPLPSGDTVRFMALDTNILNRGGDRAESQVEWMDVVLESSRDRWVVVYGHHPMVSGGWHSPSKRVREYLLPRLQGRASLFLSGHNHSTELLLTDEGVYQAVCGGGGGLDNAYRVATTPLTLSAFSNGGWCFLHIWPDTLAVEGYNRVGTLRFRELISRPKKRGADVFRLPGPRPPAEGDRVRGPAADPPPF
jgi:tartrate-resistant acid phosphatase type 5